MKYTNIFGHYHEASEGEPSLAEIYDGKFMKRKKVIIKGKELIQLTEPKKLYFKRGVTRATFQRNLRRLTKQISNK